MKLAANTRVQLTQREVRLIIAATKLHDRESIGMDAVTTQAIRSKMELALNRLAMVEDVR